LLAAAVDDDDARASRVEKRVFSFWESFNGFLIVSRVSTRSSHTYGNLIFAFFLWVN
jgi:hypothetical protein